MGITYKRKKFQNTLDKRLEYQAFLKTNFWKNLSFKRKELSGFKCEGYGRIENLQCHHILYRDSWFATRLDDLLVLCDICHKKAHFDKPIIKRSDKITKGKVTKILAETYKLGYKKSAFIVRFLSKKKNHKARNILFNFLKKSKKDIDKVYEIILSSVPIKIGECDRQSPKGRAEANNLGETKSKPPGTMPANYLHGEPKGNDCTASTPANQVPLVNS